MSHVQSKKKNVYSIVIGQSVLYKFFRFVLQCCSSILFIYLFTYFDLTGALRSPTMIVKLFLPPILSIFASYILSLCCLVHMFITVISSNPNPTSKYFSSGEDGEHSDKLFKFKKKKKNLTTDWQTYQSTSCFKNDCFQQSSKYKGKATENALYR